MQSFGSAKNPSAGHVKFVHISVVPAEREIEKEREEEIARERERERLRDRDKETQTTEQKTQ